LNFVPLATASTTNLKIFVYDPENPNRALQSSGVFFKKDNNSWAFLTGNGDGTVYASWDPGSYLIDTVEPSGAAAKYQRRTYSVTVDQNRSVAIAGVTANTLGFFTLTIDLKTTEGKTDFVPRNSCQLLGQDGNLFLNSGFPRRADRLKITGTIRALIIPVDFPDVVGRNSPSEEFFAMANGTDLFFQQVSGGRVNFAFQTLKNYVRMPFNSNEFNLGSWSSGNPNGYYKAALEVADPFVDYSQFDVVYILSPRTVPSSSIAYGPAFITKVETDDGFIYNGSISGADAYQNFPGADWKWMAHETGHLFGLHDLYTVSPQPATYGSWDIMSLNWTEQAIELNSWNRYISGWLDESEINCLENSSITSSAITRTLTPLVVKNSGTRAQFIRLSSTQILVAEFRVTAGLDVIPKTNEGVLLYTVDMTVQSIKGGWSVHRRPDSVMKDFMDAPLRAGESITVAGIKIEVISQSSTSAVVRFSQS